MHLICVSILFVFFFFKQKTAYEMRISDWSSDVCSSDLEMSDPLICIFLAASRIYGISQGRFCTAIIFRIVVTNRPAQSRPLLDEVMPSRKWWNGDRKSVV